MMKKLKSILVRVVTSLPLTILYLLLKNISLSLWEALYTIIGAISFMDDAFAAIFGSSSSVPTSDSEASVNQQAPNPEPPLPELSDPLLDDNTRRAELDERAGFHFVGLSEEKKEKVLLAQVQIERAIEKALLSDGYSRDELSQKSKRDEIRGFLFYRNGKLLSIKKYESYVEEVKFGTHRSQPYQDLIHAISDSYLFLNKVKKIKRWER